MSYLPIIGLMSGTSFDGIDTSLIYSNGNKIKRTQFNFISKYKNKTLVLLRKALTNPMDFVRNIEEYNKLEKYITEDHAEAVSIITNKSKIKPELIGFHGQTLLHNPQQGLSIQIGNGNLLSKLLNCKVIYNFRNADLINGGQGAPISPIYHKLILEQFNIILPSLIINIGGITNLTFWNGKNLLGFDVGPGNNLMDYYTTLNFNQKYDIDGNLASQGNSKKDLVKKFCKHIFFKTSPPKSLERKVLFDNQALMEIYALNHYDCLATLSDLVCETILSSYFYLPEKPKLAVIVGGGAKNKNLIRNLRKKLNHDVLVGSEVGLNVDYVESELIGFLAARFLNKIPSTFSSTTGALKPTILGVEAK